METYKIINDINILKDFINNYLPDLNFGECFYVCLFARSKYCKDIVHISSDKQQLKRVTCNKENLIQKLQQMECTLGSYYQRTTQIPQEALAAYISINPRSYIKAIKLTADKFNQLLIIKYNGYNPHKEIMSNIQRSLSRKIYLDIDFDGISYETIKEIIKNNNIINESAISYLITRGGFHLLVKYSDIDKEYQKTFYNNIMKLPGIDIKGDNVIPIPGCYQGGFTPYFIK